MGGNEDLKPLGAPDSKGVPSFSQVRLLLGAYKKDWGEQRRPTPLAVNPTFQNFFLHDGKGLNN